MKLHQLCGFSRIAPRESIENSEVLLHPGFHAVEPGVAPALDESPQSILLLNCPDEEGIAAELDNGVVKRGVDIVGPGAVDRPAPGHLVKQLEVLLP